jgi:hypothetical protein
VSAENQSAGVDRTLATTAASPLGTPEQLAAERLRAETVNTLSVDQRVMTHEELRGYLPADDLVTV